ncbi:unnamed protein product, partial [Heterosigma akashiwo]
EGEDPDALDPFTIKRVNRQAGLGNLKKAVSLLQEPALLDINETVLQQLRDKHPSRPTSPIPDFLGRTPGDLSLSEQELVKNVQEEYRRAISTASKGSAPGISGWRYEHLQCLLEPSMGPRPLADNMTPVYSFFNRILLGDLPEWCRSLLRFGRGFALAKPGGGVRPITVTDVFRRVVTRAV